MVDGLPKLIGTPKQVLWAENIRDHALSAIRAHYAAGREQLAAESEPQVTVEQWGELERRVLADLAARASASWWIDHRDGIRDITQPVHERALADLLA